MEQIRLRRKYLEKNGGIDEVVNNLDKQKQYVKFLSKILTKSKRHINLSWKQKRKK